MNWEKQQYLSLSTRKRDGSRVETPVWFALEDGVFYIFSAGNAGKIKRIRNFADVLISPCTVTGSITGAAKTGNAVILQTEADICHAHRALLRKYGWKMRLLDIGAGIAGKKKKRAFVKITPALS